MAGRRGAGDGANGKGANGNGQQLERRPRQRRAATTTPPPLREMATEQLAQVRQILTMERAFDLATRVATLAGIVLLGFFFFDAAKAFAGKETNFNGVIKAAFGLSIDRYAAYAVAAVCGTGYYRERKKNRKSIKAREKYIRDLEEIVDPRRQSSGLDAEGRPRKALPEPATEHQEHASLDVAVEKRGG